RFCVSKDERHVEACGSDFGMGAEKARGARIIRHRGFDEGIDEALKIEVRVFDERFESGPAAEALFVSDRELSVVERGLGLAESWRMPSQALQRCGVSVFSGLE